MGRSRIRSNLRRSLIVVVDGLAVWALAILLASHAAEPSAAGDGQTALVALTGTMHGWLATPGVGPFEGAAYVGLAIAAVGPVWYWLVQPVGAALRRRPDEKREPPAEFEFDVRSELGAPSKSATRLRSSFARRIEPGQPDWTGSVDWVDTLFDGEPPTHRDPAQAARTQGDLLRAPGGSPPGRPSGNGSGGHSPSDRADRQGSDKPDSPEVKSIVDGGTVMQHGSSSAEADEPASGAAGDDPTETDRHDHPDTTDDPPTIAGDDQLVDPMDALVATVAEARSHLDTAEANLAVAGNGHAGMVEESITAVAESAEQRLDQLRADLPNGAQDIGVAIADIRRAEDRIEAGFEANFGEG